MCSYNNWQDLILKIHPTNFQDDTPPDVVDDDEDGSTIETTTVMSSHTTTSSSTLSHHGTRLSSHLTRDHPELTADVVTDEI